MALAVRHPTEHTGPLTFADLQQFPDDGLRYEIVDGVLLVTPAPNTAHQTCVANLIVILTAAVPPDLQVLPAPFDWLIDDMTCVEPDVLVFRRADVGAKRLAAPPVLAVEVLSPGTARVDRGVKLHAYEDAGLPWYWLVDPVDPRLTVLQLVDGRFVPRADVVGDESHTATTPFAVTLAASDLLR